MRRGPRFVGLLASACRRTPLVSFEDLPDGRVEVLWLSPRGPLFSLERFAADKAEFCLLKIISYEDERALRRQHGADCPCEDCCIARVDRDRLY